MNAKDSGDKSWCSIFFTKWASSETQWMVIAQRPDLTNTKKEWKTFRMGPMQNCSCVEGLETVEVFQPIIEWSQSWAIARHIEFEKPVEQWWGGDGAQDQAEFRQRELGYTSSLRSPGHDGMKAIMSVMVMMVMLTVARGSDDGNLSSVHIACKELPTLSLEFNICLANNMLLLIIFAIFCLPPVEARRTR